MATTVNTRQVEDGTISRVDMNTTVSGRAVITKVISGSTGVVITNSTGTDAGTGDVTLGADITYFNTQYQNRTISQSQNTVWAAPSSGSGVPTFRTLTASDVPAETDPLSIRKLSPAQSDLNFWDGNNSFFRVAASGTGAPFVWGAWTSINAARDSTTGFQMTIGSGSSDDHLYIRRNNSGTMGSWNKVPWSTEIPTVNNGTLTMNTAGILTGSASFTANQSGNSTFTVTSPAFGTTSGTIAEGNHTHTLQQVTTAGNTSTNSIVVNTGPGNAGFYLGSAAGTLRWLLRTVNTESGSNSGSDLVFVSRTDAGANLADVARFTRSNGQVTFPAYAGTGVRPGGYDANGLITIIPYGTTAGTISQGNHTHTLQQVASTGSTYTGSITTAGLTLSNLTGSYTRMATINASGVVGVQDIPVENDFQILVNGIVGLDPTPVTIYTYPLESGSAYSFQIRTLLKGSTSPIESAAYTNAVLANNNSGTSVVIGNEDIHSPITTSGLSTVVLSFAVSGANLLLQMSDSASATVSFRMSIIAIRIL